MHTTPENLPHISFACGATMSSPFIRRAIVTEERYSDWLWNSVRHSKFCPLFDSGPARRDANEGTRAKMWLALTMWVVLVHPDCSFLVTSNDR